MPDHRDSDPAGIHRPDRVDADRIPDWTDRSHTGLIRWWQTMAARQLAFHPDDPPEIVFNFIDGEPLFTPAACRKLRAVLADMAAEHGPAVYQVAEQEVMAALGRQEMERR